MNGVGVRIAPDLGNISQSYLIDATPWTFSYGDSTLVPNESVSDPVSGITIKTLSVSSASATVNVQFGGTPPPPPPRRLRPRPRRLRLRPRLLLRRPRRPRRPRHLLRPRHRRRLRHLRRRPGTRRARRR